MESRRHHQRPRSARGPPPVPPHHQPHPRHHQPPHHRHQNPSDDHAATDTFLSRPHRNMEDDTISTLMDIDDSPLSAGGAGFLDEEDGEGEMFLAPHRMGRGGVIGPGEGRGTLLFADFYNSFDGADFDDTDLA